MFRFRFERQLACHFSLINQCTSDNYIPLLPNFLLENFEAHCPNNFILIAYTRTLKEAVHSARRRGRRPRLVSARRRGYRIVPASLRRRRNVSASLRRRRIVAAWCRGRRIAPATFGMGNSPRLSANNAPTPSGNGIHGENYFCVKANSDRDYCSRRSNANCASIIEVCQWSLENCRSGAVNVLFFWMILLCFHKVLLI